LLITTVTHLHVRHSDVGLTYHFQGRLFRHSW